MGKYIDEYLVALGFDLDSKEGKAFLALEEEIEKENKELGFSDEAVAKSAKKRSDAQKGRIADTKEEIDLSEKMREADEKLKKSKGGGSEAAPQQEEKRSVRTSKPPAQEKKEQAPSEPPAPGKKSPTPSKPPSPKADTTQVDSLKKSIGQLGKAWDSFRNGNFITALTQGASGARSFGTYVDTLGGAFGKTNKQAGGLKKTLTDIFGGKASDAAASGLGDIAESAAATEDAATGAAVAAGSAAGPIGLAIVAAAAAAAKVGKSFVNMSDSIADANTNIETMARQLWISDSAAYQLNNSLGAMGKTTADLNEIAINPTLNARFKTLQQQAAGQDNTKIQKAGKDWADVQTEWDKFTQSATHAVDTVKANIIESLAPDIKADIGGLGQAANAADKALNGGNSSTYAPQNAYYSSNYAEGAKIEISPRINVNANSSSAQDIASATTNAVTDSMNNSALVRNVRGLTR